MYKYNTIIWDYNGTILDDLQLCRKIINELLQRYQLPTMTTRKYRDMFSFPIEDYYEKTGITAYESFDVLAEEFSRKYNESVGELTCFPDVRKAIRTFHSLGINQLVISAARQQDVIKQMKALGLAVYFNELLGIDNIFAASKAALAVAWGQANRIKDQRILVVGDSDHDHEIAEILQADCLLISRGHISHRRLEKVGVPVKRNAKDLLALVTGEQLD